MDLRALLILMAKRWALSAPLMLLTVILVVVGVNQVSPTFEATGSVLLVGPAAPTEGEGSGAVNPLLEFTRSLDTTGAVIVGILSDPDQGRLFASEGLSADFTVSLDKSAPIVAFSARSPDADVAIATVRALFEAVDKQLVDRQGAVGAPPDLFIRTQPISEPLHAATLQVARVRAALALAVAGILSTVTLVLAYDRLVSRRESRWAREGRYAPVSLGRADLGHDADAVARALGRNRGAGAPSVTTPEGATLSDPEHQPGGGATNPGGWLGPGARDEPPTAEDAVGRERRQPADEPPEALAAFRGAERSGVAVHDSGPGSPIDDLTRESAMRQLLQLAEGADREDAEVRDPDAAPKTRGARYH